MRYIIANSPNQPIPSTHSWTEIVEFKSKDRIFVPQFFILPDGTETLPKWNTQHYQVVRKWKRKFTYSELAKNYATGCLKIVKLTLTFGYDIGIDWQKNRFYFGKMSDSEYLAAKKVAYRFFQSEKRVHILVPVTDTLLIDDEKTEFFYFLNPQILTENAVTIKPKGAKKAQLVQFAIITTAGKEEVRPVVTTKINGETVYQLYDGNSFEILLKIGQNSFNKFSISTILDHPANTLINKGEFFNFLLESNASNTPRICTLTAINTCEALTLRGNVAIPSEIVERLRSRWHDEPTVLAILAPLPNG